ncbi:MAG TPA: NrsF family protein [Acetobacteraceae bacterium]|jgi:hypothetical protein
MPTPTDQLILALVRDATPVRRLRPPLQRALSWLAVVAVIATAATAAFTDWQVFDTRILNPDLVIEMTGTLLTGCLAVIAAFHLSLPDRSPRWALLPIPSLILWLSGSGMGCYRHWLTNPTGDWALGDSAHCFMFILAVGLPLSAGLLWALRRARPISPVPVALVGGLGAASLAAFLLQFFHPFDITFMDLSVHALAVLIVIGIVAAKPVRAGLLATREG